MVGPAENKAWKILESEYLVKRPWLTARRDKVELPDGRVNDEYYVLEYPDWVNVIAVTEDGMFVMESQYRHGLGAACYEIPCGVIEEEQSSPKSRSPSRGTLRFSGTPSSEPFLPS